MKNKTLADRLVQLRTEYGLNVNEFAMRAKLSHVAVLNIENGKVKNPQKETIAAISATYGTTSSWLMSGIGEMFSNGKLKLPLLIEESKNAWEAEAYHNVKAERDGLKLELERVWAMLNHITGGKVPGFHKAIKATDLAYLFPNKRYSRSLVAQG